MISGGLLRQYPSSPPSGIIIPTTNQTVYSTSGDTSFVIPAGVTKIYAKIWGAGGGGAGRNSSVSGRGGAGGYVEGLIEVTPGETLTIRRGGAGLGGKTTSVSGGSPGGGGSVPAGSSTRGGGSGGGYSGILRSSTILICAGGGGGGGVGLGIANPSYGGDADGNGFPETPVSQGGSTGSSTHAFGSKAGTVAEGGYSGVTFSSGTVYRGYNGSAGTGGASERISSDNAGGAGGGGYNGGGGGAGYCSGGGGASYVNPAEEFGRIWPITTSGTPANQSDSDYISGKAVGGAAGASNNTNGSDGGTGLIIIYY